MGFDVNRFVGPIDEELICSICSGVLENPAQAPVCEHAFCRACICEWLSANSTCPVDRSFVLVSCLRPVPRILKNLLNKLQIRCDNSSHGCDEILRLESLTDHMAVCQHNPKRPILCDNCGLVVPQDQMQDHSCVTELRKLYDQCLIRISILESEVQDIRSEFSVTTRARLPRPTFPTRPFPALVTNRSDSPTNTTIVSGPQNNNQSSSINPIRALGVNEVAVAPVPSPSIIQPSQMTTNQVGITDELLRWINGLPMARVTRWGGMISTPDMVLQGVIRRALIDSGCPHRVLQQLMVNAHERSWPSGLQNLETRQINRMYYESYICRRIPGRQAVVVMAADNRHMESDMICDPGIVMIFAHGVQ